MKSKDNTFMKEFIDRVIVPEIMISVVLRLIHKSLSKEDYEENNTEIFDQIIGTIIENDIRRKTK